MRLQLGRGFSAAERTGATVKAYAPYELQLGRGFSAAERYAVDVQTTGVCGRFNWAAAFQPRKVSDVDRKTTARLKLQLGRGFSAAESMLHRQPSYPAQCFNWAAAFQPRKAGAAANATAALLASIGPRLFSRGKQ